MTTAITLSQSKELVALEAAIEKGKKTFVEVGLALARIRDGKLFQADYETFEEYCRDRWGWSRPYCVQLIQAAAVAKSLPEGVAIATESQARELSKAAPEQREEVLEEAASAGPVTAKAIRKAVQRRQSPAPEPEETPEPPQVIASDRSKEPQDAIGGINVVQYFAIRVEEIVDEAIAAKASAPQLRALSLACQAGARKATAAAKDGQ